MVPTVPVVRSEAVIEVSWHDTIGGTVPINSGGTVIIVAVIAADGASVAIAVVATWSPRAVIAGIVARVVGTWSPGVLRGIALPHLNTQAS